MHGARWRVVLTKEAEEHFHKLFHPLSSSLGSFLHLPMQISARHTLLIRGLD